MNKEYVEYPEPPAVHYPPPILVLNEVPSLQEQKFHITCASCKAHLEFMTHHIHRQYNRLWFWLPPQLAINCPVCEFSIDITNTLPMWMRVKVGT